MEFVITEAKDWNMLVTIGGASFAFVNIVLFALIAIIYKGLPKKEDLNTLADRFEAALGKLSDRHEDNIKTLDKEHDVELTGLAAKFEQALDKLVANQDLVRSKEYNTLWADLREGRHTCQANVNGEFKMVWDALKDCQRDCCLPQTKKVL